jgi:hypothetical protein
MCSFARTYHNCTTYLNKMSCNNKKSGAGAAFKYGFNYSYFPKAFFSVIAGFFMVTGGDDGGRAGQY